MTGDSEPRRRHGPRLAGAFVVALLLGAALAPARAQLSSPAPAPTPAPAPRENPGLINELGKIIDNPSSLLPRFGFPREAEPPPVASPPDATDPPPVAASPLPAAPAPAPPPATPEATPKLVPGVVSGRLLCPVRPGGGPDCDAAATALCQSKGYRSGQSLSADTAENCSAKMLIPGRGKRPEDCRISSYVTRALCQ